MEDQKIEKAGPYERRRQVLRLLAEHGPLSAEGMAACLTQPSSDRALRAVRKRLYEKGVLAHRHDQVTGRIFHQISQHPRAQELAAEILGVRPEDLKQPHFRHAELLHSEQCAVWTEILRLLFPKAKVQRDFQFASSSEAESLMLSRREERDLLPDILLTHEAQAPYSRIAVAIEIERTAKSKARLVRKLWRCATQTRLDGLIYVTSSSSLQKRLLDVYQSKVVQNALRIGHYGRHFLLFTDGSGKQGHYEPLMFNSNLDAVSLREWMSTLIATKSGGRRDSIFKNHSPDRNGVVPREKLKAQRENYEGTST